MQTYEIDRELEQRRYEQQLRSLCDEAYADDTTAERREEIFGEIAVISHFGI